MFYNYYFYSQQSTSVVLNLLNIVTTEKGLMDYNYPLFKNNKLQLAIN